MDYFVTFNRLIVLLVPWIWSTVWSQSTQSYNITSETAAIYERFYLIKRIEHVFELFKRPQVSRLITFLYINPDNYQHPLIYTMASSMIEHKSIEPLYALWHIYKQYQQLYDDRFQLEFIHVLYALCSGFGDEPRRYKDTASSLQDLIEAIDEALSDYGVQTRSLWQPVAERVSTDMIAQRYLILKRLGKATKTLNILCDRKVCFDMNSMRRDYTRDIFELDIDRFTHDRIKDCIAHLYAEKNLEPLKLLMTDVEQYRFIADDRFLQEMLMNIFLVYKTLLFNSASDAESHVIVEQMNQVLHLYESIEDMPLDETLEAIDVVTDKLLALQAEEHEGYAWHKKIYYGAGISALIVGIGISYMMW